MGEASLAPRQFGSQADVHFIVDGLIARDLPRALWTHEGNLAAITGILVERAGIHPETDTRDIISGHNAAIGGVNDDTQGYHDTMSHVWIKVARAHCAAHPRLPLLPLVNALVAGPDGDRDVSLRHCLHERLLSVAARGAITAPELAPLPGTG